MIKNLICWLTKYHSIMNKAFEFIIYLNRNNRGNVVLESTDQHVKISNLMEILPFAGTMEQLCRAMETGAQQNFSMNLFAGRNAQWLFECSFIRKLILLNLWLNEKSTRSVNPLFSWRGSIGAFRAGLRIV